MKLSKKSCFILAVGIPIAIFASLWVIHNQQVHEQERLHEELSVATMRLENPQNNEEISAQQVQLEEQISQAISQLETAKAMFSQSAESITVSGALFDIAEVVDVEITAISSSHLSGNNWQGIACLVLPVTVTVEGDVHDIISFVGRLNSDFKLGVVKSVVISIPETTSEEKASANIQLDIYTYQGE